MRPPIIYGSPFLIIRMLYGSGSIPVSKWFKALLYTIRSFFMFPFSLREHLFLSKKIWSVKIEQTPLFIIGHYRSGTTLLHKVMAADPRWSSISTFDFLFPYIPVSLEKSVKDILKWVIRRFRIQHPHFHNYRVDLDDPLEEDMISISSLTPHSAFWGEVLPKSAKKHFDRQVFFENRKQKEVWKQAYLYLVKRLTYRKKQWLILKNPPNTGRVDAILELFPDAKFIFIYRNPYQVYYSTTSLWKRTLEKHYALQKISDQERDEIIFSLYSSLMRKYEMDRELIPAGNLVEVRYETFENSPLPEIKRIYQELDLPDFKQTESEIRRRLHRERSYRKYSYSYDQRVQDKVCDQWGYFIDKWNYDRLN